MWGFEKIFPIYMYILYVYYVRVVLLSSAKETQH